MPRRARLDDQGTLHHVMIRGIEKQRIVDDAAGRRNFAKSPGEPAAGAHTAIYAWSLMTNLAYILLRSSQFGLCGFMRSA